MARRELTHFEDADGHVVTPRQVTLQRTDSEYWGETERRDALNVPTRYSPCRVGLTHRIRRMRPHEAYRVQAAEIAHEVACTFEGDEEGPVEPCRACLRRPPRGAVWTEEDPA